MTTITRTITVAGGVFAPGHLGELTRHVPFDLVDAILTENRAVQRRLRDLPTRVGVYFVLALTLFPRIGHTRVWDKLTAGLTGHTVPTPSEKALRDLRARVGTAPLQALFETIAGPLARPHTPGVRHRRHRTVALDGCTSIKTPDSARNRAWLGRIRHIQAWAGYPTIMLMALVETGTRALIGARFGPITDGGETHYATRLLHLLTPDMLLLTDRGFDSTKFLTDVAATGAQFLTRIKGNRRPPVLATLTDGSHLTRFDTLKIRIIEATITVTTTTGTVLTTHYRLATTLLDHRTHPADTLIRLYHERWEIETALHSLRHTILDGHVLRSTTPDGLHQELWALLTTYQTLRMSIVEAIETEPGTDPDRASFTIAIEHARNQITNANNIQPDPHDRLGVIGTALLNNLLPNRRPRTSLRKVKSPTSRYAGRPPGDNRPTTSTNIAITTEIHPRHRTPPRHQHHDPHGNTHSHLDQVLTLLTTDPTRNWTIPEIAAHVPFRTGSNCRTQLRNWTHAGHIRNTARGRYALPEQTQPLTNTTKP